MSKQIWKTSIAMMAAAMLIAGCGSGKKDQESPADLPGIETEVNLVVNPGMEEWDGYKLAGWTMRIFAGNGNKLTLYGRSDKAKAGEASLYVRGLFDTEKWIVATQRFPVRPGYTIIFSAEMMVEDIKA